MRTFSALVAPGPIKRSHSPITPALGRGSVFSDSTISRLFNSLSSLLKLVLQGIPSLYGSAPGGSGNLPSGVRAARACREQGHHSDGADQPPETGASKITTALMPTSQPPR